MLIYGFRRKLVRDIWAGTYQCPHCGRVSHFHLMKLKMILTLFFIPCLSIVQKRFLVCDCCESAMELSKEEYKARHKGQIAMLENRSIPQDVVLRDFNAKELNLVGHIIALIVSGLFALLMDFSMLSIMFDLENIDMVSIVFVLAFCTVFTLPFLIVLKNFFLKMKKYELYKSFSNTQF